VCAIVAIVAAVAVPVSLAGVDRARGWAASRFVAARFAQARARAVGRGAAVAVRIDGRDLNAELSSFADTNRNGLLTREIDDGVESRLDGPTMLAALFPGVAVTDEGMVRLFSFSPDGTATTGSLYLRSRDGTRFAIRVLGVTARVRIERFVVARGDWVEGF